MQLGVFDLGSLQFTTPVTGTAIGHSTGAVINMDGVQHLNFQARLDAVGTNGTSAKAWLQTSLDQGTTWFDIACASLGGTTGAIRHGIDGRVTRQNLVPTDGALADNTVLDGVLGNRFRWKITTTGTFGPGSTLSGRVVPSS